MLQTKLIFVEGIIGSGKSTTARFLTENAQPLCCPARAGRLRWLGPTVPRLSGYERRNRCWASHPYAEHRQYSGFVGGIPPGHACVSWGDISQSNEFDASNSKRVKTRWLHVNSRFYATAIACSTAPRQSPSRAAAHASAVGWRRRPRAGQRSHRRRRRWCRCRAPGRSPP
jgi:hypothetical protein